MARRRVLNLQDYSSIMSTAKDLTKEAPRSPSKRVGNYVILGRTLDKGRAVIAGTAWASITSIVRSTTCFSASRK